eukprot:GFUD01027866.1.p1 GENE.GFUD01027866.1~~GFUD01027866.1.p1  ORF type:complete len:706 (+),score=174.98 GFUD01027866.1:41-2158(+)
MGTLVISQHWNKRFILTLLFGSVYADNKHHALDRLNMTGNDEDGFYNQTLDFDGDPENTLSSNDTYEYDTPDILTTELVDLSEEPVHHPQTSFDTDDVENKSVPDIKEISNIAFYENSTMISAVGLLKYVENNLLKEKIRNMQTSNDILKTYFEKEIEEMKEKARKQKDEHEQEKKTMRETHKVELDVLQRRNKLTQKMYEMEMLNHQNTQNVDRNNDIVLKFLMEAHKNIEKEIDALQENNKSQEKKIEIQQLKEDHCENQNLILSNELKKMGGLLKKEEKSKKRLRNALLKERDICQSYVKRLNSDIKTPNHFEFMVDMSKTMLDQHTLIEDLNSFFDDQKSIESSLDDVLVELIILNSQNMLNNISSILLNSCQAVVHAQRESLAFLRPQMSYIVENHSRLTYEQDEEGNIIEVRPCQCLPEVPKSSNIRVSSTKFSCPAEFVTKDEGEPSIDIDCESGQCPRNILSECIEYLETPWSEWRDPCLNNDSCLAGGNLRTRKTRSFINESFTEESEMIHTGSKYLIVDKDKTLEVWSNGSLGFFLVGGGGGGEGGRDRWNGRKGGSSGLFQYDNIKAEMKGPTIVNIIVGQGGGTSRNGKPSLVTVDGFTNQITITANGGRSSHYKSSKLSSSRKIVPICGDLNLSLGSNGQQQSSRNGQGEGGVIIDGKKPTRRNTFDGEGFGAGGGRDNTGYPGLVIVMICD